MPRYASACRSGADHLGVGRSFKAEPLTTCPNCGGALRKVFGSIGIAFKGSGFYRTDSRSGSKSGKKEPAKASTDKASTDKSSTDKPATAQNTSDSTTTKASGTNAAS